jgi:hypothetical protein
MITKTVIQELFFVNEPLKDQDHAIEVALRTCLLC